MPDYRIHKNIISLTNHLPLLILSMKLELIENDIFLFKDKDIFFSKIKINYEKMIMNYLVSPVSFLNANPSKPIFFPETVLNKQLIMRFANRFR